MVRAKKSTFKRRRLIVIGLMLAIALLIIVRYLQAVSIPVFQTAGPIAAGEKRLLITAFLLMLIIVIPVFVLTFFIAWRYRETNKKAAYTPHWDHSRVAETIWWLIPSALIAVLAVINWQGTFRYDPYRPIASAQKTMTIQVVALDWRWLFIYPEQKIATVNYLQMPINTPVRFEITADAPMNSFWIPQLGGQVYAMPGMDTRLHLMADKLGTFNGSSANISGKGFAGMRFTAQATSLDNFNNWAKQASTAKPLTLSEYNQLAQASTDSTRVTYSAPAQNLYDTIINKYMGMEHTDTTMDNEHHMMEGM